jgi:hypothetical protein
MKYLRTIEFDETQSSTEDLAPTINDFCGVRLIRDKIGVLAVHAKDGPNWVGIWQQDAAIQLSPEMALKLTTSEWAAGQAQGSLVVVADVSFFFPLNAHFHSCPYNNIADQFGADASRPPRTLPCLTSTRNISPKRDLHSKITFETSRISFCPVKRRAYLFYLFLNIMHSRPHQWLGKSAPLAAFAWQKNMRQPPDDSLQLQPSARTHKHASQDNPHPARPGAAQRGQ